MKTKNQVLIGTFLFLVSISIFAQQNASEIISLKKVINDWDLKLQSTITNGNFTTQGVIAYVRYSDKTGKVKTLPIKSQKEADGCLSIGTKYIFYILSDEKGFIRLISKVFIEPNGNESGGDGLLNCYFNESGKLVGLFREFDGYGGGDKEKRLFNINGILISSECSNNFNSGDKYEKVKCENIDIYLDNTSTDLKPPIQYFYNDNSWKNLNKIKAAFKL